MPVPLTHLLIQLIHLLSSQNMAAVGKTHPQPFFEAGNASLPASWNEVIWNDMTWNYVIRKKRFCVRWFGWIWNGMEPYEGIWSHLLWYDVLWHEIWWEVFASQRLPFNGAIFRHRAWRTSLAKFPWICWRGLFYFWFFVWTVFRSIGTKHMCWIERGAHGLAGSITFERSAENQKELDQRCLERQGPEIQARWRTERNNLRSDPVVAGCNLAAAMSWKVNVFRHFGLAQGRTCFFKMMIYDACLMQKHLRIFAAQCWKFRVSHVGSPL